MKKKRVLSTVLIMFISVFLTSCSNKSTSKDKDYGISSPISYLSWGTSIDECKSNLADHQIDMNNEDNSLFYRLSPTVSILGYTDEITEILLKFDPASTEEYYPYHSEALSSIQIVFTDIDLNQLKDKITELVGSEGEHWVDSKDIYYVTWKSTDTLDNLDHDSYQLLEDLWLLLESNTNVKVAQYKEKIQSINKVVMHYTTENDCSVEFFGGVNVLLFNLKQVDK
ncbi:hypothetical protein [Anaerosporobacter faecicola]|uniref:hypothetical protein n=1 Tax=Anaerosporobacter faecicola TaxID=2718714 RepID=UPI00143A73A9|nr:hypothetical protein [Anaerosporobacter faecicola]